MGPGRGDGVGRLWLTDTDTPRLHAMAKITGAGKALEAGRFGHGLGMQLTEWPSFIPDDHTEILEGMILTLEPSIETIDGRIMVHEENIVIRKDGAEKLSTFYKEMVII